MRCPTCASHTPQGAKFCPECGGTLPGSCASCGQELPASAKFCPECGSSVARTAAEAQRGARKVVTVVFCDLAASTSLQDRMDPESVRRVMDGFYAAMRAAVDAHDGRVVKTTGDGVMAVFGAPDVREDDAIRAVRAADAMQLRFAAVADSVERDHGAKIALRVGVNTGEVVVSSSDDDVVGDAVNVASRLEHAAGNGQVFVGEETWKLVRDAASFDPVPPLEVRGKADLVRAFRLVSMEPPDSRVAVTPFVGRDAELKRLQSVFDEVTATRSPRLATVIGSPGLGKTRLARELAESLADRARVLEVRCDPAGTATFAPIAEALRLAAAIPDVASADEIVAAFRVLAGDDDRAAAHVASLLGAGSAATPQETFWAVRRVFESLASDRPVLLVLDDVHWAEPMLLDLVEHLGEWSRESPLMLVALARPEMRDLRPSLTEAGGRSATVIVLEGLDASSTTALAGSLLGWHDLPAAVVERLLVTSEGNPLFLRELLRMLVDDGVLRRDGERWVAAVAADQINVPPSINALLSARIERLQTDERMVIERASVVGKEFYRGAVTELVAAAVKPRVDGHLETLRRKAFVEPEGSYWIDEPVFRFHHVLIRDAAYRRLLKEARAELHERFADWLERKVGALVGEHEEVLGFHLEQAHEYLRQLGPLDDHAVALGERAATHLAAAARRALDRDDLASAASLSGRALDRATEDARRTEILIDRCEALLSMGDVAAGAAAVDELRELASGPRVAAWADCFTGQLVILRDPARLHETERMIARAAAQLASVGDAAATAKAHQVHAQALARLGRVGACEAALDRALAAAREAGDRRRANAVLSSAPLAALWGPSPVPRASGRCLDVVRVLRITQGAPNVEATALRCQAVLEGLRGRFDAARRMLGSAREKLEELGLRHALLETDVFCGIVELLAGDARAAEGHLRPAFEEFASLGVDADAGRAAALLARACLTQGRDAEALELTHDAERLGGDDLKSAIAWRSVRAEALARRGDVEDALALARDAVALAEPTDVLVDHADARTALANVLRTAGRTAEADEEAGRAAALLERKAATLGLELSQLVAGPGAPARGGVFTAPGVQAGTWVALYGSWRAAMSSRDWSKVASLYSPGMLYANRQRGLRFETSVVEEIIAAQRAMFDREHDWTIQIVASAGPRCVALMRSFGPADESSGQWEALRAVYAEVASDGTMRHAEIFDDEDRDLAFDVLFRAAAADDPGAARDALVAWKPVRLGGLAPLGAAVLERWCLATFEGDWDEARRCFSEDLVYIDHRAGLRAEPSGREPVLVAMRETFGERGQRWLYDLVDCRDDVVLTRVRSWGDGWERIHLALFVYAPDGTITRAEMFDDGDVAAARSRLAELASYELEPSARIIRANAITAYCEKFSDAIVHRDVHAAGDTMAADYRIVHHVLHTELDREWSLGELRRAMAATSDFRWEVVPLATIGQRHGLFRSRWWFGQTHYALGASELPEIYASRAGPDGRCVLDELYGPDHVHDALARLCELYADDELDGADADRMRATGAMWREFVESYRANDWERFAALLDPDVEGVDNRPASLGVMRGIDAVVAAPRGLAAVSDGLTLRATDVLALDERFGLLELLAFGTAYAGGAFETPFLMSFEIAASRIKRFQLWAPEQRNDALADARRCLARPGATGTTAVEAALDRVFRAISAPDMDAFTRAHDPELRHFDHVHRLTHSLAEHAAIVGDVLATPQLEVRHEVVMRLGVRHAVARVSAVWKGGADGWTDAGPGDNAWFWTVRVGTDERLSVLEMFADDQLHAALARAEELYVDDEADTEEAAASASRLAVWRCIEDGPAGRWDDFANAYDPDVVSVDHRPAGWGEIAGRDAFIANIRALVDQAREWRWEIGPLHALDARGYVFAIRVTGVDVSGGSLEVPYVMTGQFGPRGVVRQDFYPPEDLAAAFTRFHDLRPRTARDTVTLWYERLRAGDWGGLGDLCADDLVIDERGRSGLRSVAHGRDAALGSFRHIGDLANLVVERDTIATRGDRLALERHHLVGVDTDGGAFDVEWLSVNEVDDAGRLRVCVLFDSHDAAAAIAELDLRSGALRDTTDSAID